MKCGASPQTWKRSSQRAVRLSVPTIERSGCLHAVGELMDINIHASRSCPSRARQTLSEQTHLETESFERARVAEPASSTMSVPVPPSRGAAPPSSGAAPPSRGAAPLVGFKIRFIDASGGGRLPGCARRRESHNHRGLSKLSNPRPSEFFTRPGFLACRTTGGTRRGLQHGRDEVTQRIRKLLYLS